MLVYKVKYFLHVVRISSFISFRFTWNTSKFSNLWRLSFIKFRF